MFIRTFFLFIALHSTNVLECSLIKRDKSYEPRVFATCFEEIGCIDTNEKWYHEKYRPHNLEPLDRHTIRTEFLLMKNPKNNSNDLVYDIMALKRESVEVSGFKKGTCSIFIIHDFTSNGYTGWVKHLVVAFTRKTDCNIISVDWQAGAEPPFEQAIANARVVALEAKIFITMILSCFGQSTENLHLVGHGVGAHIAGYIGKYILGVQRITGLDPTGPMFARMPKEVRLDADDAKYVEILHTDAFNHRSQGTKIPYGHADFFINDAQHQPGCNDSSHMPSFTDLHRDSLQEGRILPACSHKRSFKYYIQALEDEECQFIGIACPNFKSFIAGKCNDCIKLPKNGTTCATFGLEPPSVTTKNNTFYMLTNSHKPFCMVSYGVNITVFQTNTTHEVEGYFEFIMVDDNDKVTNASSNVYNKVIRKFEAGHVYSAVFYGLPPAINKIKEAKVRWNYKSKKLCILCDKGIAVKEISIKRLTIKPVASAITNVICPIKKGVEIKSGDYVQFQPCENIYGKNYLKGGHKQIAKKPPRPETPYPNQISQAALRNKSKEVCESFGGSKNACENLDSESTTCGSSGNVIVKARGEVTSSPKSQDSSTTRRPAAVDVLSTAGKPSSMAEESSYKADDVFDETTKQKDLKAFKDCYDEGLTTTTTECCLEKKSTTESDISTVSV